MLHNTKTQTFYLYAYKGYYAPRLGRFTQEDTHWNEGNNIYDDNPGENPMPSITAIMQSGNLYVYCINNPAIYSDSSGKFIHIAIGAAIGAVALGVTNYAKQKAAGGEINMKEVWASAGVGAAGGALIATGVGAVAGVNIMGGAAAGATVIGGSTLLPSTVVAAEVLGGVGAGLAMRGATEAGRQGSDAGSIVAQATDPSSVMIDAAFGAAGGTVTALGTAKVVTNSFGANNGWGFNAGKNPQFLYENPKVQGGTFFNYKASSGTNYRWDWTPGQGHHFHPPSNHR